jgi:hypothetical protein
MARPTVRTEFMVRDDVTLISQLFGTIANGHRLLGLKESVPEPEYRRAMKNDPIRPEHKQAIEDAWDEWKSRYLTNMNVLSFSMEDDRPFFSDT